ncbi:MAG TPA: hypothetical protein VMQ50_05575 [Casimicrobiaceae bacterium]|nr:hypothetical protein [Casimicrobiaceae bacterium]
MAPPRSILFRLLCIAILATGCSSLTARTAVDYERGGVPEAKFKKDAESCDKQAAAHQKEFGNGQFDPSKGPYNRMYDMCMRSSGYALKQQP